MRAQRTGQRTLQRIGSERLTRRGVVRCLQEDPEWEPTASRGPTGTWTSVDMFRIVTTLRFEINTQGDVFQEKRTATPKGSPLIRYSPVLDAG